MHYFIYRTHNSEFMFSCTVIEMTSKKVNSDITAVEKEKPCDKEARALQMHSKPHATTGASHCYWGHKHPCATEYAGVIKRIKTLHKKLLFVTESGPTNQPGR